VVCKLEPPTRLVRKKCLTANIYKHLSFSFIECIHWECIVQGETPMYKIRHASAINNQMGRVAVTVLKQGKVQGMQTMPRTDLEAYRKVFENMKGYSLRIKVCR